MTRVLLFIFVTAPACAQSLFPNGLARFAGAALFNYTGDGGPAYYAALDGASSVARDSAGNLYIAESSRIRKIDTHGTVSTLLASVAASGIAADPAGNVYISQNGQIERIVASGALTVIAGSGQAAYNGEGAPALSAGMTPSALAIDAQGQIYFIDAPNYRVRMIRSDGKVYTVAGTGEQGSAGEGGPAIEAQLYLPGAIALDAAGNLYIADAAARVVKVDAQGMLTRFAGTGIAADVPQPGQPAAQTGIEALGLAADGAGDVFIAGGPIYEVAADGILRQLTPASGSACVSQLEASIQAVALTLDPAGDVYFINRVVTSTEVYELAPPGALTIIAGMGPNLYTGDGGPASAATFAAPSGIAFDAAGSLYIADTNNNRIRRIDARGIVSTVAGAGGPTYDQSAACLPDSSALLNHPQAVTVDSTGGLYIADTGKNRIVKIAPDGTAADAIAAGAQYLGAALNQPIGVAVDASGNLYVADSGNHRLLEVSASGGLLNAINIAVSGEPSFDAAGNLLIPAQSQVFLLRASDGALLQTAAVKYAAAAAVEDAAGSIYASDPSDAAIERTSPHCAMTSDGSAQLSNPVGLAFDSSGNLYAADSGNNSIWMAAPVPAPANENATPVLSPGHPVGNAAPTIPPQQFEPNPFSQQPFFAQEPAAPGELVRIFGACIGPLDPVSAAYDANGNLPLALAGVSVAMNGIAMPLLSVSEGIVVAQVPLAETPVAAPASSIQLAYNGGSSLSLAPVAGAYPGLFTTSGLTSGTAVALNQDGALNSSSNPAQAGSVVALFGSGFGLASPPGVTGQAAPANPLETIAGVTVSIGGVNAPVVFAGNAPGLVGVTQINVQIPSGLASGALNLDWSAPGEYAPFQHGQVTLYVR